MTTHNLAKLAAAAALLGALTAQAATNPLDPGYYVGQPGRVATSVDPTPYVDANNPLNPVHNYAFTFTQNGFEATSKGAQEDYRDLRNPLYPGFVRE